MPLSRLELAAALIEYDNDDDVHRPSPSPSSPPHIRKTHRDSAIFKPYQRRPLDDAPPVHHINPHSAAPTSHRVNDEDRPESRFRDPANTARVRPQPIYGNGLPSHADLTYEKASTSSELAPYRPESGYGIALDTGTISGEQPLSGRQASMNDRVDRVDVSQWGLPSHLVSPDTLSSSSLSTLIPRLARRSVPPLHAVSKRAGEITSPLPDRAASIHLDYESLSVPEQGRGGSSSPDQSIEEVLEEGEGKRQIDHSGVDEVLAHAERVRRMVDDVENECKSVELTRQSLEATRRSSNPLMIPLPSSPAPPSPRSMGIPLSGLSRDLGLEMGNESYGRGMEEVGVVRGMRQEKAVIVEGPNPFALPAPAPGMGSMFDPKILQEQRGSSNSPEGRDSRPSFAGSQGGYGDTSRSEDRGDLTISSMGPDAYRQRRSDMRTTAHGPGPLTPTETTKSYPDIPTPEEYGRPLLPAKYLPRPALPGAMRRSYLRPSTLIMPSSLADQPPPPAKRENIPEGYTLGEKPLPPGAKSSILHSSSSSLSFPAGFGRPGLPLSLSQQTFRSSLMVGGEREEGFVGGTEEEGGIGIGRVEGEELWEIREDGGRQRRPGKLFGTSLIDQLEARKAAQRSKQRVFTGDSRPAMMARSSRSSQFLSPPSSGPSPSSSTRPVSLQAPPLLQIDPNGEVRTIDAAQVIDRISKSKSVFGVDQIWEKEMAKLKIIQAREAKEREIQEEQEERSKREKDEQQDRLRRDKEEKRRKKKGKGRAVDPLILGETDANFDIYELRPLRTGDLGTYSGVSPAGRISNLPPTVEHTPDKMSASANPFPTQGMSGENIVPLPAPETSNQLGVGDWFGDNDDEGESRPRGDKEADAGPQEQHEALAVSIEESNKEDGLDLGQVAPTSISASLSVPTVEVGETDDEDEMPLSRFLPKSLSINDLAPSNDASGRPASWFGARPPILLTASTSIDTEKQEHPSAHVVDPKCSPFGDEDDDIPLLLTRFANLAPQPMPAEGADEDDLPLGYKHSQVAQRQSLAAHHARMAGSLWAQEYEEQARRMVSPAPPGIGYIVPFPGHGGAFPGQGSWYPPPLGMVQGPGAACGCVPLGYQGGFQCGHQGGYSVGYQGGYSGGHAGGYPWPQPPVGLPMTVPGMDWTGPSPVPTPVSAEAFVEVPGLKQTEQIDSWRKGVRSVSSVSTAAAGGTGDST